MATSGRYQAMERKLLEYLSVYCDHCVKDLSLSFVSHLIIMH